MEFIGQHFGYWEVLDSRMNNIKGETKWLCRCVCGIERYVLERSLKYGNSKSCGCINRKKAQDTIVHKLSGKTFGDLIVLKEAEQQRKHGGRWWTCQCACGNLYDVSGSLLVTGKKTHCGCKAPPKNYHYINVAGKKFHQITALYRLESKKSKKNVVWHCRCDCGTEFDISYNDLVYTNQMSCGCKKKKHTENLHSYLTYVNGTSLDCIKSKKIPIDNTTGVKGVYFVKGKWMAKIVFQKKQYHLGNYDTLEAAAAARSEAEHLLFDGAVEHYEKWRQMAQEDSEWANQNPVKIFVEKKYGGELKVTFFPILN